MNTYPAWLGTLNGKAESLRKHHGLSPGPDGWYKWVDGRRRYIARRMSLDQVVQILPHRLGELRGLVVEKSTSLAISSTSIEELAEMFLAHLWQRHQTGQPRKLSRYTYADYLDVLERFCSVVGPRQPAIAAHAGWFTLFARSIASKAATSRRREMIYIKAFFKWAGPGEYALGFYQTPVKFGPDFVAPSEGVMREAREEYSTAYTQAQIEAALQLVYQVPILHAAGLVALNCAFLPVDLITVPFSALDLDGQAIDFPRGKNGNPRKSHLMPETVAALRRYIDQWRKPRADDAEPIFVGDDGRPFGLHRESGPGKHVQRSNALSQYWGTITGLPMKGLRTTFATEADDAVDQVAVDLVLGHAAKSVRSKFYVKRFDACRLSAVVNQVWSRVGPRKPPPDVAELSAARLKAFLVETRGASATPPGPVRESGTAAESSLG